MPRVEPGYLRELCDTKPPSEGEPWQQIFADVEGVLMPGMTQWQSPHMHAYFPALNSWPSLLGDMLANSINCINFSWAANPAGTELETLVLDWLAQLLAIPSKFRFDKSKSHGGGMILTTLSESTFLALLAARKKAIFKFRECNNDEVTPDAVINSKLIAYCSDQAHSSVEKACIVTFIELRCLPCDAETFAMQADVLAQAIAEDRSKGKIPFFVCATLGTTGCCAFDNLEQIAPICCNQSLWLHVDAAYAGTSFVCPEFRYLMKGIEMAQSFAFNPSKWMMVHFDCTAFWVENSHDLHNVFLQSPVYINDNVDWNSSSASTCSGGKAVDYENWHLPQSRRFRSLKLWLVIYSFKISFLSLTIFNLGLY